MAEISTTWILGHFPLKFVSNPYCRFFALKSFKTCYNDNMRLYSDRGTLSRHFEYAGAHARAIEAKSEASGK